MSQSERALPPTPRAAELISNDTTDAYGGLPNDGNQIDGAPYRGGSILVAPAARHAYERADKVSLPVVRTPNPMYLSADAWKEADW
jgi:hypothetical protein